MEGMNDACDRALFRNGRQDVLPRQGAWSGSHPRHLWRIRRVIDVATVEMLEGDLPQRALSMVSEWVSLHRAELIDMWNTQNIRALPPLE